MGILNDKDMKANQRIDRIYPSQVVNNSEDEKTTSILVSQEEDILLAVRKFKENQNIYKLFDEDFGLYLSKMSNTPAKRYVEEIFNRQMIYLGYNPKQKAGVFTKIFVGDNSLNGVVLESTKLDINLRTGETSNIDDCVYSAYFGILRAAVIIKQKEIFSNFDLHKLLTTYLYQLYLKVIGVKNFYSDKAKYLLRLICIYAYHRNFFGKTHQKTVSIIRKDYAETFQNQDLFKELVPQLENLTKFSMIREIPKMLVATNLYHSNPSQINLELLKNIGSFNYYSISGTLDYFIATVVLVKYPTDMLSSQGSGSSKIHDSVEKIMEDYIKQIKLKKIEF